jgi:pyruvate/2-oxoglutarate dehydrogenase complex dihydrolipoamide dehydrogenase (E3) component
VAAQFAAGLGLRVGAVERARVGGDCLWTGCVPSKALLASAKAAHAMRTAGRLGLEPVDPQVDTARVWARVRAVQEDLAATTDSPEHLRAAGVDVHLGEAQLVGTNAVEVDGATLEARFILVATGSEPRLPPIPGLREARPLTNETVFGLERAPRSTVLVGAGPQDVELAQALVRLGVRATLLGRDASLLPRDEPELAARLADRLRAEGVDVQLGVRVERVTVQDGERVVHAPGRTWRAAEVLVGTGRRPVVEGLGLERLGVEVGEDGVVVDARLRTTVPTIYAAGDVAGRQRFTHTAGFEAARAVRNMFLPGRAERGFVVPWCTFTDPELAHAGLTEAQARAEHGDAVRVWRADLADSDRLRAEGTADGALHLVCARGRLVGAHVLAPAAGEVIGELTLAIEQRLKLPDLAGVVHPYPTVAIAIQQLAGRAALAGARRFAWLARRRSA